MRNIVIISGGSGNDSLLKGICEIYPFANIKVIVNAYDDGKSTGVCREITNTLGVSDIRKNHFRMYRIKHKGYVDKAIAEFYSQRYDLPHGKEMDFVVSKLMGWGLRSFVKFAINFFCSCDKEYLFGDFNIANIVYSQMYKELGYEWTNKVMCAFLGIQDFVVLNSFDNIHLSAKTKNGIIKNESGIVDFSNRDDKIIKLVYKSEEPIILNKYAINDILNADIIIISTGTFFSSILPTIEYGNLYKVINNSSAKKYWFMNNEEDKDSYGFGSNDFVDIVKNVGLKIEDFTIILNDDAKEALRQKNSKVRAINAKMGCENGKHDPTKMAKTLFLDYYNLLGNNYDLILVDYDNTIFAKGEIDKKVSIDNLIELSRNDKITIISGNDYYTSIRPFIKKVFGDELHGFGNHIWSDASSILYYKDKAIDCIKENVFDQQTKDKIITYLLNVLNIKACANDETNTTCIKIKPLNTLERELLCLYLNKHVFGELGINDVKAVKTGKTTVDIVKINNDKSVVFKNMNLNLLNTIYIGDELDSCGNDREIANMCNTSIHVKDIRETNLVLKLLNSHL